MRRPRLVYAVTHPISADLLLRGQLTFMREHGFDVTVVAAPGEALDRVRDREKVTVVPIPMERDMNPRADAVSLARLTAAFRRLEPDIVNAGTTKAGLLGMMAARAANVPLRVYLLRGLRLETAHGVARKILTATEWIASACADEVVCVSRSLERIAVEGGYIPREKALVVGEGSSNGVDVTRFSRTEARVAEGKRKLAELGIPLDAPLVGFVGRLVSDKGIEELVAAFERVRARVPAARLLLVGGDLGDQDAPKHLTKLVREAKNVHAIGSVKDIVPFYAVMRVLALPSYREGFPNVVLEAAAMGMPVVGFRSTGVVDAIEDGMTGAIVDQRDVVALGDRLAGYLEDPERAAESGRRARARVERSFSGPAVWRAWLEFYRDRLAARALPVPRIEESGIGPFA